MGHEDLVEFKCVICELTTSLKKPADDAAIIPVGWHLGRREDTFVCSGACKGRDLENSKPQHP